jgi:hypothetical protein
VGKTIKVKLEIENISSFFVIQTHCDVKQFTTMDELKEVYEITCCECDEPLMLRGSNGLWYYLGERVFE